MFQALSQRIYSQSHLGKQAEQQMPTKYTEVLIYQLKINLRVCPNILILIKENYMLNK